MRNHEKHASPFRWLLRRYIFLAVLTLLVGFAIFPMQGMMRVLSASRYLANLKEPLKQNMASYYTQELSQNFIYSPLNLELLCLLFAGMGYISAMVLFRHLFSRKQGMLVAGLPMTRTRGFLLRTGVYALWCLVPLILCMGVHPLLVRGYGLWQLFDLNLYLRMVGAVLLIHLYGFAMGALCASLFGTIWSAALGTLLLAGSVEIALLCWTLLARMYLNTLYAEQVFLTIGKLSPVYSMYQAFLQPLQSNAVPGILTTLLFLVLAFLAYRCTMPEMAGHTLAHRKLEPLLIAWITVLGGTAGALILSAYLGREIMVYLGTVLGAALAWALLRMLLDQRIHISLRKWKLPLAVTCGMLCVLLGLRTDLFGYNTWRPETEALKEIQMVRRYDNGEPIRFSDPESISACMSWIDQARETMLEYRQEGAFRNAGDMNMVVYFEGKDGRETCRQYPLPADQAAVLPALQVMAKSYALQLSEKLPQIRQVRCYSRLHTFDLGTAEFFDTFGFSTMGDTLLRLDAEKVRQALREDLKNRTLETMQEAPLLNISFEGYNEETGEYEYSNAYTITASDRHTLALILGEDAEKWIDYARGGFARCDRVKVFLCGYEQQQDGAWKLASWKAASSEEEVREWMSQVDLCDDEWLSLPQDLSRRIQIYSLESIREQIEYGELSSDLDLEDPEVLNNLPALEKIWETVNCCFFAGNET